jgi:murein DD-endopeptidase MepM/ murein hydrolase activator NlpD
MEPVLIKSPLKGEWMVVNSPGSKVPSHGTHSFASTYAFDLMQVDWTQKPVKFHRKSTLDHILGLVHLADCYTYGKPIYAPISGRVMEALDGYPERDPVQPLRDISVAFKNAWFFDPHKHNIQDIAGNFVIIQGKGVWDGVWAFLGHMKTSSVKVGNGDLIEPGDLLGNVGHSGNSTAPHLHFQLMDGPDATTAKGIPCCFEEYELYQDEHWITIENGIPKNEDRILL